MELSGTCDSPPSTGFASARAFKNFQPYGCTGSLSGYADCRVAFLHSSALAAVPDRVQ